MGRPFTICTTVCKPAATGIAWAGQYPESPLLWTCVGMRERGTPEGDSRDLRPPSLLTPDWSEWRQLQPVMWPSHHQREDTHIPLTQHTHPFGLGSQHFDCFFWMQDTFDELCAPCLKQKRRERGSRSEIHHYVVQNILVFQAKSQAVVSRQPIRVNAVWLIHVTCFSCERTIILCTFPTIRYRGGRMRR